MFCWSPDVIRFRQDAVRYYNFDEQIALRILPHLPAGAHVCDAGCGLGYLGLALAQRGMRVSAVDNSPEALAVLRENAAACPGVELCVVRDDLFSMRVDEPYDAMAFSFFGRTDEILRAVKAQCAGTAFLVKKNWDTHRFTMTKKPLERFTFTQTCAELDKRRVPYRTETFLLEMGQPFGSLADAALFYRTYGVDDAAKTATEADVVKLLERIDSPEFSYYLPSKRQIGMILVDAGTIPDSI